MDVNHQTPLLTGSKKAATTPLRLFPVDRRAYSSLKREFDGHSIRRFRPLFKGT